MKNALKWLENAIYEIRKHDLSIARSETAILEILLQIESRKEYSLQGFDGLYSFCIKTFGWSESQTATRTQAMYALQSVPELKEKIDQGTMSLTAVAQVERYIRQEQVEAGVKPTQEERREIFESFENKTVSEVKLEIAERRGERIKLKLALELDEEAEALWTEVRNLSAHQTKGSSLNCLKLLMRSYLEVKKKEPRLRNGSGNGEGKAQPSRRCESTASLKEGALKGTSLKGTSVRARAGVNGAETREVVSEQKGDNSDATFNGTFQKKPRRTSSSSTKVNPRYIPAALKREIYARDRHQCRNCGSKHALQIDHIVPIAKGGESTLENLRLLCRSCNLGRARQAHLAVRAVDLRQDWAQF